MPLDDHHRRLQRLDQLVAREVSKRIAEHGVPKNQDEVLALAQAVHPVVAKYRHEYYRVDVRNLGASFAEYGLEIAPAPERAYPLRAVVEAVQRAAGFGRGAEKIGAAFVDDVTSKLLSKSVAAYVFADNPGVQRQFLRRLSAALVRHARKAGRDGLVDSVERGNIRDSVSKRPFGGDVGYARVLTGRESCAFCAMLASRGPVYSKDTVLRTDVGRRYHDNCDCIAVPVVRGKPWPGQGEFEKLQREWRAVTWENGHPAGDQWEKWRKHVAAGGIDPAKYSPLEHEAERGASPGKLAGFSRKGSKRRMKNPIKGVNPTGDNNNCIRCVHAYALRKLGYDAVAAPGQYDVPKAIRGPLTNAEYSTLFWRDKHGNTPKWESSDTGVGAIRWSAVKTKMESDYPIGAYGFIRASKPWGQAHVAVWERTKSGIKVLDPQNNGISPEEFLEDASRGSIRWARIDGFSPIPDVKSVVEGGTT